MERRGSISRALLTQSVDCASCSVLTESCNCCYARSLAFAVACAVTAPLPRAYCADDLASVHSTLVISVRILHQTSA